VEWLRGSQIRRSEGVNVAPACSSSYWIPQCDRQSPSELGRRGLCGAWRNAAGRRLDWRPLRPIAASGWSLRAPRRVADGARFEFEAEGDVLECGGMGLGVREAGEGQSSATEGEESLDRGKT